MSLSHVIHVLEVSPAESACWDPMETSETGAAHAGGAGYGRDDGLNVRLGYRRTGDGLLLTWGCEAALLPKEM